MNTPRRIWWPLAGAAGLATLAGYLAHVWYFRVYVNDDAYITFRYSLFLALGRGPYYNVGEHVEGYTNFLLMLMMAAVTKVAGAGAVAIAAKIVGAAGGLLALVAAWALGARWLRKSESLAGAAPLLACCGPALVAANAAYALNSVSGLETTMFSGWLLLGLWLLDKSHAEGRWRGAGVAFALAAMTRPEGAIAYAAALIGRLLNGKPRSRANWRPLAIDTLIVAVVSAAHLVFRYLYYDGELLPNTYHAKTGGMSQTVQTGSYLWKFAGYHLGGWACLLALLPLIVGRPATRRASLPAILVCAAAVVGLFKTGADWMIGYRLLVPYAPIWAALAVCGIASMADRIGRRPLTVASAGCVALLVWVGMQGDIRRQYHDLCAARAEGYREGHASLADWLRARTETGDTVALMDIGIIGFRCPDLHILDISGLTDRHIAKSPGNFLAKQYDPSYVLDRQPEFIVIVWGSSRDDPTRLNGWTAMEREIVRHPRFTQHYYRRRQPAPGSDKYETTAAALGADRVFHHRYPGQTYLLALYGRKPAVATSAPRPDNGAAQSRGPRH